MLTDLAFTLLELFLVLARLEDRPLLGQLPVAASALPGIERGTLRTRSAPAVAGIELYHGAVVRGGERRIHVRAPDRDPGNHAHAHREIRVAPPSTPSCSARRRW